ncbi:MAG: hypothetical protein U0Y96_15490 [Candidatus Kapaibacterium sp.]
MIQYLKRQWQPKTSKVLLPLDVDELCNELYLYFNKQGKYKAVFATIAGRFISERLFEIQPLLAPCNRGVRRNEFLSDLSWEFSQGKQIESYSDFIKSRSIKYITPSFTLLVSTKCTIVSGDEGSIIEITTTPQKFALYGLIGLMFTFILMAVLIGIDKGIDVVNTITTFLFGAIVCVGSLIFMMKSRVYFSVEGLYKVLRTIAGKQQITIYPHPR